VKMYKQVVLCKEGATGQEADAKLTAVINNQEAAGWQLVNMYEANCTCHDGCDWAPTRQVFGLFTRTTDACAASVDSESSDMPRRGW
jgi:hypothetical protein